MTGTYAVNWQEQLEPTQTGKLELRPSSLVFDGMNGLAPSSAEIPYRDISAVRIARLSSERIAGRPTLVLDRSTGPSIRIASVAQPGVVSELAEHLARLQVEEEGAVT